MKVEIDINSGFCFGVVYAIQMAESVLSTNEQLYCLGDIVHNSVEVQRLKDKGLVTIDHAQFKTLKNCKVLIRAHGEPPETYRIAMENNIELIDASCPVVLKLQQNIKKGFDKISIFDGQLVIYGKEGHAEVNGLVGQTSGKAIVINSFADLNKIDFTKSVNLFSQTTQSRDGFRKIKEEIQKRLQEAQPNHKIIFEANDTICRQVSGREPKLRDFAKNHDVVIFVSGKKSSNGKILYNVCKEENSKTYFVSEPKELVIEWFKGVESVGICGATSTPMWLMKEIGKEIENINLNIT
ncbi:MAG: 4-hydroxy-3-methylbut-2-enyl diphosphate reductase [Bacteroidetes bacterium RIFOXYA12_FULL_33_9]|nr:MAG: 4-hydroxy-3-methylbut-2-enyl diphosphate reductase [Bacteroidetes bacterium RIFOXYA12_FULL_33_9]